MSEPNQAGSSSFPQSVSPWLRLIIYLAAVLTIIWGVVEFFNPVEEVDLTVYVPPKDPTYMPDGGGDIRQVVVLDVNISNSGSASIGEEEKLWKLTLRSNDGETVDLLGEPKTKPSDVEVEVISDSLLMDRQILQIGVFKKDESIDLQLLLVEPQSLDFPLIMAETRVPNLMLRTTSEPLSSVIRDALFVPFWCFIAVLVLIVLGKVFRKQPEERPGQTVTKGIWKHLKEVRLFSTYTLLIAALAAAMVFVVAAFSMALAFSLSAIIGWIYI